jgi:exosortase A
VKKGRGAMPPDLALELPRDGASGLQPAWRKPLARLALAWAALFALAFTEWREMAHQWWDIDTYAHILLIPAILGWLVWTRRGELAGLAPAAWWPGLVWLFAGLIAWLAGREAEINLLAQVGAVAALQGAVLALLGLRASLLLAFPLGYAFFLVPFGDEIVPQLQAITARIAIALTHLSGVSATIEGINIDTPAGRFIVAEACSGVKFLVAMVALTTLAAGTGMKRWPRRVVLVAGGALASVIANGVRAWGTIFIAQYVGAEAAGSFDHIVYGWVFFAIVIATVLAVAWPWFDREPAEAGYSAVELDRLAMVRFERHGIAGAWALAAIGLSLVLFAVLDRLG